MSTLLSLLLAAVLCLAVLAVLGWPLLVLTGLWAHLGAKADIWNAEGIERLLADD